MEGEVFARFGDPLQPFFPQRPVSHLLPGWHLEHGLPIEVGCAVFNLLVEIDGLLLCLDRGGVTNGVSMTRRVQKLQSYNLGKVSEDSQNPQNGGKCLNGTASLFTLIFASFPHTISMK